jgi:hypothetical protein
MLKSQPIDIPGGMKRKFFGAKRASPRVSQSPESWPPLYRRHRHIVIEVQSPIVNYNTMSTLLKDSVPDLSDDDITCVLDTLNKKKLVKISCDSTQAAYQGCRKLVENGIAAWTE